MLECECGEKFDVDVDWEPSFSVVKEQKKEL